MSDNNQLGVCSTLCDCVCSVTEDGKCDVIKELRAEVEALRPDAERYRWLRAKKVLSLTTDCTRWTRPDGTKFVSSHRLAADDTLYGAYPSLDETIDAALATLRGKGE